MNLFTILCEKVIGYVSVILKLFVMITIVILFVVYFIYLLATAMISNVSYFFKERYKESTSSEEKHNNENNITPIVLVHGVFGFGEGKMGHLSYFGGLEKKHERVLVPDLGWLTSMHDRARELFYYLKGGQVDFGKEHSNIYGHSQFGRFYNKGKYSEWDENHPIHFVGHSAGAQVVRVLQQMLADKLDNLPLDYILGKYVLSYTPSDSIDSIYYDTNIYNSKKADFNVKPIFAFKGYENTSGDWVASLTSLCGALNGSTRTYIAGMETDEWKSTEAISLLGIGGKGLVILEWLDIWWLKKYTNFGFHHFNISWRNIGFKGLLDCLAGNSGPFGRGDWALPDLTLQGSIEINREIKTHPNTFYLSYAAKVTKKAKEGFTTLPSAVPCFNFLLLLQVYQMCLWKYPPHLPPPYNGYRDEDWWDNDGELNTISMTHPRIPIEHPHHFLSNNSELPNQPGIWYYKILEAHHTQFVAPSGQGEPDYSKLYETIFNHCRNLVTKNTPNRAFIETGEPEEQNQTNNFG